MLKARQSFSQYSFVFGLVLMRLAQSSSKSKKTTCLASLGLSVVRERGSKVDYARWSGHSLKVLDGRDKLVVESNPTILKSHLNQDVQVCIINIWAWAMQYTYCTKFGVANQVTFEDFWIWLHHQFVFPIEYFQVMAGPPCILDLWPPYAHHGRAHRSQTSGFLRFYY